MENHLQSKLDHAVWLILPHQSPSQFSTRSVVDHLQLRRSMSVGVQFADIKDKKRGYLQAKLENSRRQ